MLQVGCQANLVQESLCPDRRTKLRPEDLDGYASPAVLRIGCEEHRRHPTSAERALNGVTVGKGMLELFQEISHSELPKGLESSRGLVRVGICRARTRPRGDSGRGERP